jgi:hypothetical protein
MVEWETRERRRKMMAKGQGERMTVKAKKKGFEEGERRLDESW